MRTTIDKAGRVVIPKRLREELGLRPGEVELSTDGSALRIEPVRGQGSVERDGRMIIPKADVEIDDEVVRALRDAGQR